MSIEKERPSYQDIEDMVNGIAQKLRDEKFDAMMVITRGGMIPGSILGYRLGIRNILVAAVEFYDDETGKPAHAPTFLQFPADPLLRAQRILVVDEVWDSGKTIESVVQRVRMAGGTPVTCVLHYKPGNSKVDALPDYHARATDAWIVYPWSGHVQQD